jgi:hypothetical protein
VSRDFLLLVFFLNQFPQASDYTMGRLEFFRKFAEIFAARGLPPVSNGNASETKANESFDNGVFFDIEAKRTPSLESKLFSKRSEHIRSNKNNFRSEANTFDIKTTVFYAKVNTSVSKKLFFEAKRTH